MITLDDLATKYNTDKSTNYAGVSRHGYAPIYETYLNIWRNSEIRMLEIGICMEHTEGGHSIKMWNEYFTKAKIYTFDIVDMSNHEAVVNSDRVEFFRGDQSNRDDFKSMYSTFGETQFEFILEDGSHVHQHQMISLAALFPYVKSGGFYILEDMSIPNRPVCCIRNDETYAIIENFKTTGKISSAYMTAEEIKYLEDNVESIDIYPDVQNAYAVAIIKKK